MTRPLSMSIRWSWCSVGGLLVAAAAGAEVVALEDALLSNSFSVR